MPTLFKPIGAVLGLIFALSFAAPNAAADEFVYTYTVITNPAFFGATFTTDPVAPITTETTILAADLASFSLTGRFYQGTTFTSLVLDHGAGNQLIIFGVGNFLEAADGYAPSDYSTPGTYNSGISTLTVTDVTAVATPEPSSLALMLFGVGLVSAMRKRSSGL